MGKNNIGVSQTSTLDESFYKSEKSKVKKYKIVELVAIICVLGVSINYFNKKYIYTNVIAKNIFIEGIDVSNLTKEEAINYVNENVILGELQLNYNGETNVISPDEIDLKYNTSEVVDEAYHYTKTDSYFENVKRFFDLNKNSKNLEIKSLYNENKLSEKIQNISDSINVDMKNAKVYISDSGNISVSSATIGKELDIASTKESIYDAIKNKDYKSIDLKVNIKEPKISTEAVKSVNTLLAEFSTKFSTKDSNRVTNVVLSAKATSDVLLMPGEEFSYNNLTGKRTASNGYKDAPVIINGKLEQDVGGGVCQVSSTLFNSVLYSGLDVTSRRNHSLKSSYVSIGRDAMVSDGGSDFRFKNPYSHPVYIKNTVSNGVITSKIYGNTSDKKNISIKVEPYTTGGLDAAKTYIEYKDSNGKVIRTQYISNSVYKN
ncbi:MULTISPECIES: VanW family protein [Romboutsia]|jgi:vancomycin resistance protein YoaR|uniref:VanW family protein n=1 Tax=Romboutsia TaxID=1501226 RepID=UPI002171CBF3|nr:MULTISPECIES: VanW family protein [Romboutsia]MCI9061109.1 vancomycin resistance protein [Romboutsia sp.]